MTNELKRREDNAPAPAPQGWDMSLAALPLDVMAKREEIVQKTLQKMTEGPYESGAHYGRIPGVKQRVLYKRGAQAMAFQFQLRPEYVVDSSTRTNALIAYSVTCNLYAANGLHVGSGTGSCNTGESKMSKQASRKGVWDCDHNVRQMANKRALVDAVIAVTGAGSFLQSEMDLDFQEKPQRHTADVSTSDLSKKDLVAEFYRLRDLCEAQKLGDVLDKVDFDPSARMVPELTKDVEMMRGALK